MCGDLVPSLNKNRSKELIASFSIVLGLVWLAVALRFISRRVAAAKLGLDDWLILVALVRRLGLPLKTYYLTVTYFLASRLAQGEMGKKSEKNIDI